jgi:hypothetical protein
VSDQPGEAAETRPTLFAVKGGATVEEVAALTAVLHALAASAAPAPEPPRSEWAAHHRKVRTPLSAGPGGWRSSSLPR